MKKWKWVYFAGITVTAAAVVALLVYAFYQARQLDAFKEVKEEASVSEPSEETEVTASEESYETVIVNSDTGEEEVRIVDPQLECPVDFYALWDTNTDIYGWITIPGTQVDYPVLQHTGTYEDSNYYLRRGIDGSDSSAGCIYSQYYYNTNFDEDNLTVIYGHNMLDDSMFGSLDNYNNEDYIEQNQNIYFYTSYHSYRYRIIGVVNHDNVNLMFMYGDFEDFVSDFNSQNAGTGWYDEDYQLSEDDHVLALSTCNPNHVDRFIVYAVRDESV